MRLGSSMAATVPGLGPVVVVLLTILDSLSAKDCSRDGGTFACLISYFNDTGQDIPVELAGLLMANKKQRRSRRESGQDGYQHVNTFLDEWCGPFSEYKACMTKAAEGCSQAPVYSCILMTSFASKFGDTICGSDVRIWSKHRDASCQPQHGNSLSAGKIVIGACALMTYIHHAFLS